MINLLSESISEAPASMGKGLPAQDGTRRKMLLSSCPHGFADKVQSSDNPPSRTRVWPETPMAVRMARFAHRVGDRSHFLAANRSLIPELLGNTPSGSTHRHGITCAS